MHEHINIIIGDGKDTKLFYDNWLPFGNLAKLMSNDIKVWGEDLNVCQWWHGTKGWQIPSSFSRRYSHLAEEISKIQLSNSRDSVKWKPDINGQFSVGQYYNMIRKTTPKVPWHRLVWSGKIPGRYRFFMWLLVQQRLKTRELLNKRGMSLDLACSLCSNGVDNCKHLFF